MWRKVLPGLIVTLLGAAGVATLLVMVNHVSGLAVWDDPITENMFLRRTDGLSAVATAMTSVFSSTVLPFVVLVLCGIWWAVTRRWREPVLFLGSMALMLVVSVVLKKIVGRPRPPGDMMAIIDFETSFSFPSGHTIAAATFALVGGYLVWSAHRTRLAAVVWIVVSVVVISLIALTRLYLTYHYLTDVLAGASAGVAVLGVVMMIDQLFPGIGQGPRGGTSSPQTATPR